MRAPKKYTEKDVQYILSCVKKHGVSRGCKIASEVLGRTFTAVKHKYRKEINPQYKRNQMLIGMSHNADALRKISVLIGRDLITEIYGNPTNLQQCFENISQRTQYSKSVVEHVWYRVLKKETKVFQINENCRWNVKNKPRRR